MKFILPSPKTALFAALILCGLSAGEAFSQSCGGNIIRGASGPGQFLDPNGDGGIVANSGGSGFSNCALGYVDEMTEFEDLTNPTGCGACQVGWTRISLGDETDSDLWAGGSGCGSTDIVPDSPTGSYGYFTVRDPDGVCANGDELLIFRIRIDANVSGSFSYSILFDADGLLGPDDPNGVVCGSKGANSGFEYEIVANPANGQNIEVRNIDGVYGDYGTDPAHSNGVATAAYDNTIYYNQANACRSVCSTSPCNSSGAVYHTFAVRLTDVGETCGLFDFRFAGMTASSGSGTISSGTSVSDLGGTADIDCGAGSTIPCNCCLECTNASSAYYCGASAGAIDNCLMGCVTGCVATTNNPLPVVLSSFYGVKDQSAILVKWMTSSELACDYYEVSRSTDGLHFQEVGKLQGSGTSTTQKQYELLDPTPHNGVNYYRLKQVDIDGKSSFLRTIVMTTTNDFILTMPTLLSSDILELKLYNETETMEFSIYDTQGRIRSMEKVDGQGRISDHSIDISTLEKGVYILHAKSGDVIKRVKFVRM